jgi:hypothetical protein
MTCPRFVSPSGGIPCRKPVSSPLSVARLYLKRVGPEDSRFGVLPSLVGPLPSANTLGTCLSSSGLGRGRSHFSSRSCFTSSEGSNRASSGSALPGVLRPSFRRSQIHGRLATSPRLVSPQCVPAETSVPYGDSSLCTGRGKGGRLGYVRRPHRRLLPYSDSPVFQEVAPLHVERRGLPVSSSSLRSFSRALGFYSHRERAVPTRSSQGRSSQGLPRRLAHLGRFQAVVSGSHQISSGCGTTPRVPDQFSEIGSLPEAVLHLPGDGLRHSLVYCPPIASPSSQTPGTSLLSSQEEVGLGSYSDVTVGYDGVFGSSSPSGQIAQAGVPTPVPFTLGPVPRGLGH